MSVNHRTPRDASVPARPGARRPAAEDPDLARIESLLNRLDPRIGEPGGVPGEIVLRRGPRPLADAA